MIELVLAIITIALVVISLTLNIIILIKNSQKQHVNTNQDESIKEITGLISKDLDDKLSKLRIELNTSLSNFQSSLSTMTKNEFIALIGQDVVVDYPFGRELQRWSMKNFYIDGNGEVKHNRLTLIMDAFIANARNPHKGKPTHG